MSYTVLGSGSKSLTVSDYLSSNYGTTKSVVSVSVDASGKLTWSATNTGNSNQPYVGYYLKIHNTVLYDGYYGKTTSCGANVFPRGKATTSASGSFNVGTANNIAITLKVGSGRNYTSGTSGSATLTRSSTTYYTVKFVDGLGTTLKTQDVASGGSASPPAAPTRTGYDFNGWSGTYTGVTSDRTITATWKAKNYTLKIDPNGGYRASDGSTAVIEVTKAYLSTEKISERKRTNYILTGYTLKNTSSGSTTDIGGATFTFDAATKTGTFKQGTVACTLTAQWALDAYIITYNDNGGSGGPGSTAITVGQSGNIATQAPTRLGYNFRGWGTSANAAAPTYMPGDSITLSGNITLYALWDAWVYTVTFDANGGNGPVPSNRELTGTNTGFISYETPTSKGRTFVLWASSPNGATPHYYPGYDFSSPQDGGTVTLYAMYMNTEIYFYKSGVIECIEFIEDTDVTSPQLQKDGRVIAAEFIEHDEEKIIFDKGIVYAKSFIEKEQQLVRG